VTLASDLEPLISGSLGVVSLRQPCLSEACEKALSIREAAEWADQPRIAQRQTRQQTHKDTEPDAASAISPRYAAGGSQCCMRVRKSGIEFDCSSGEFTASAKRSACKCDQPLAVYQITIRKSRGLSLMASSRAISERSGSPRTGCEAEPEELPFPRSCHRALPLFNLELTGDEVGNSSPADPLVHYEHQMLLSSV